MTYSNRCAGIAALATVMLAAVPACHALPAPVTAPSQFGRNLIVNGDAEADTGASSKQQVIAPSGWTTTGQLTAVQYGTPGGFPDHNSPGPKHRGQNDFEGGNAPLSTATQTISLRRSRVAIRTGTVRYAFSAWLGGLENQHDNARVTVQFLSATGTALGSVTLGPVTPLQRHGVTGLRYRSQSGTVPKRTAKAVVTLVITRLEGNYNDGSADNISLVLTSPFGRNLIVNGDAEADTGASSNQQVIAPSGWKTTGQLTAVQYGIPGGFPDHNSPGPKHRGQNDFEGGNAPLSTATQTISLRRLRAAIRTGTVRYAFSAWLGGFENQHDNASVTARFQSASGTSLGSVTLGPVTPLQRNQVTSLLYRLQSGTVPKRATKAVVTLVITRSEGDYNDGSADNISLVLTLKK